MIVVKEIQWTDSEDESIGMLGKRHIIVTGRGDGKHFDINIFGQMFYDLHTGNITTAKLSAVKMLEDFLNEIGQSN